MKEEIETEVTEEEYVSNPWREAIEETGEKHEYII